MAVLCSVPKTIRKGSSCPKRLTAHRNDTKFNCMDQEWPPPPQELLYHV